MFAPVLGIPAAVIVFLATHHYLTQWDWVGDKVAIDALGVCLALCAYYLVRGLDIFLEQKKDNPEPFVAPKAVPDAFGEIKELLSESSYGPFFWGIKTVDPEANKLVAVLQFTELMGSGFMIPPIQAQRLMLIQVIVEPVAEGEQKALYPNIPGNEEKALAQINVNWRIDSPLNRHTVNRIMDETTAALRESVGLPAPNKPQPKSPFEPPGWLIALTIIAVLFCNQRAEEYAAIKVKRDAEIKERQEQAQREQQKREEAERKYREYQEEQRRKADDWWKQQQRSPSPYSPNPTPPSVNPFAPQLTPSPAPSDQSGSTPWRSN